MIDVHVLTHSGTKPEWLDQCLESLAAQPCTVHVVQGVERNIAAGREMGFGLGTHPFVTFVDSDDYVLPGAMEAMCEALQGNDAAVGRERMLVDGQLSPGTVGGHHLYALRRSVLASHLPGWGERNKGIHCIYALHAVAPPVAVDRVTYVWRRHAEQSNRRMYQWRPQ